MTENPNINQKYTRAGHETKMQDNKILLLGIDPSVEKEIKVAIDEIIIIATITDKIILLCIILYTTIYYTSLFHKHRVRPPLRKTLIIFNNFTNILQDFMIYNNLYLYIRIYSLHLVS